MVVNKGVTLLWALRSSCNLKCRYCYFGSNKEKTNLSSVDEKHILNFISTFESSLVKRVFLAGGEPLYWKPIANIVSNLKDKGCQVVVCTNGLPLNNYEISLWLIGVDVDAVSISLDSFSPTYNNYWRVDPRGRGWQGVVDGIKRLVETRNMMKASTKIGIYMVVTKRNIDQIVETARFVAEMALDYFIVQPVSLLLDNDLYDELALDESYCSEFLDAVDLLKNSNLKVSLPNKVYVEMCALALSTNLSLNIYNCFGGRTLFFIKPDGSIWDCPSIYRISSILPENQQSILSSSAKDAFLNRKTNIDMRCAHFSVDCVNMWQLMAFDEILGS